MSDDLNAELVVRAGITFLLICAIIYQVVTTGEINQILSGLAGIAVGFWLGKGNTQEVVRALNVQAQLEKNRRE